MPKFQKESFFKSFILFFIVIEFFLSFIFYHYLDIEKEHYKENLFLEMKNYSYNFKNNNFDIDIVAKHSNKLYELQSDKKYLYIFVELKDDNKNLLKIFYPKIKYTNHINSINHNILIQFIFFSIIAFIISILFSFYSLYPLQQSYTILKEFIKDIIHDINTPISAIKLNLTMLDNNNDEIKAIKQSINTLEMLHKNLDNYLNDTKLNLASYKIKDILTPQIEFFHNMYDWLEWEIDIEDDIITTDKYLLNRVIYNLINNACKYNISKGFIKITYKNKILKISNSSYGIKNIHKVFDRFYKENDRGLGIGLHIVAKFLKKLNHNYTLQCNNKIVTMEVTFT